MENRVFFPQGALDRWIVDGTIELRETELTIRPIGRRYKLEEAVRVLREVSGGGDPHRLIGRVKTRAHIEQLGGEIIESSLLLEDDAYDVEPGWLGAPVGSLAEHMRSGAQENEMGARDPDDQATDEDLLARFVAGRP
jgi:hypothetical protein